MGTLREYQPAGEIAKLNYLHKEHYLYLTIPHKSQWGFSGLLSSVFFLFPQKVSVGRHVQLISQVPALLADKGRCGVLNLGYFSYITRAGRGKSGHLEVIPTRLWQFDVGFYRTILLYDVDTFLGYRLQLCLLIV